MPSTSSPTPTAAISTDLAPRTRLSVRAKASPKILSAFRLDRTESFTLPDDEIKTGVPGSWVLSKGVIVVDVISAREFDARFEEVSDRDLQISGALRSRIEQTLGFGSTETPEHLATAIDRLARLVIGNNEIHFTPGQWEEIAYRASKMGLTVEALCKRIADRVTQDFWAV